MVLRPDNRLEDGTMVPVSCQQCSAVVEARKSSLEQTSLQWHEAATQACLERRAWTPEAGNRGAVFPGCSALRIAVADAVEHGGLPVLDADPLKTNPEASASSAAH